MSLPPKPLPLLLLPLLLLALLALCRCQPVGVQCPSLDASAVCRLAGRAFEFSDGCNTISCGRGEVAASTLIACPRPRDAEELGRCQQLLQQVYSGLLNSVACPQLEAAGVCATAPANFSFTDGCNFVTCDGRGKVSTTTMVLCGAPVTAGQHGACSSLFGAVLDQLPPRSCDVNTTAVCDEQGEGFAFYDGCNSVECGPNGTSTTTLMYCDPAPADSAVCRRAIASIARPQRQFACPQLRPRLVCTAETVGFRYSDGCNDLQCTRAGEAASTLRYCPEPSGQQAAAAAAAAYCAEAVKAKTAKLRSSRRHAECLLPIDACSGAYMARWYYNGCQYCYCTDLCEAVCRGRPCPTFFGTDAEFEEECKLRRARNFG